MESKSNLRKPTLAITMGDPRGIGPEVVVKALSRTSLRRQFCPLIVGDLRVLQETGKNLGLDLPLVEAGTGDHRGEAGKIPVLSLSRFPSGRVPQDLPPKQSARASFVYLQEAGRLACAGAVAGLVTGPVSKEAIHRSGIPFRGHTEYLAEISQTKKYVMMLAGKRLRVSLVTTHVPFRTVAKSLRAEAIQSAVEITSRGLEEFFQISRPRLGVAALNPHGGEGGLFGNEEKVIARAVRAARGKGICASGPWPADTLFYRADRGEFDAVVGMYHDQVLIPLKLLDFATAVNITLGLPFIRTSVDHGVAYELAGRGAASSRSLEEAIRLGVRMALAKQGK